MAPLKYFLINFREGMRLSEQEIARIEEKIARIEEQIVTLFKNDERMEKAIDKLCGDITEIKEQLANRLPTWATILITLLGGAVGWFAGH